MEPHSRVRARRASVAVALAAAISCTLVAYVAAEAVAAPARAAGAPLTLVVPGNAVFPESLTSTRDGAVYVGSLAQRAIFRAAPGAATAEPWLEPGAHGLDGVLGVYADERAGLLWACSTQIDPAGKAPPSHSALFAFDLRTRAPRGRYPLPGAGAVCNDIAIGPDGAAYATDSTNMQVLRLARGASALEVWAGAGATASPFGASGDVLDGIAVIGSRVFVNAYRTGRLYAIEIGRGGHAGPVAEVVLDRPLENPDGMRADGAGALLVAEAGAGGRLSHVRLDGARGRVHTLATGFPDGVVAVTRVGRVAYVLEGQLDRMFGGGANAGTPVAAPKPFRATAVDVPVPR